MIDIETLTRLKMMRLSGMAEYFENLATTTDAATVSELRTPVDDRGMRRVTTASLGVSSTVLAGAPVHIPWTVQPGDRTAATRHEVASSPQWNDDSHRLVHNL